MLTIPTANPAYAERLASTPVPYAVHFGVRPEDLWRLPDYWAYAIDGDGWEAWGEKPGEVGNDHSTLHVVALTHVPYDLYEAIVQQFGDHLVTMNGGAQVVITNPFEWSAQSAWFDADGVLHGAVQVMKNQEELNG